MNNTISVREQIVENKVYQQILSDSFGGIMYDVSNRDKYDTTELIELWEQLTPVQQDECDGIIKGAIDFVWGAM